MPDSVPPPGGLQLSVLIVNWNTRDLLRACLSSLATALADVDHEVIVVDNASHDGSAQAVRDMFPHVILKAESVNRGFAVGNNLAFAIARGEHLWLLNPDTEVESNCPLLLMSFLDTNPDCGAVASALIDARTGKPQRSCRTFPGPGALWVEACGLASAFPRSRRFGFYRMGWWNYRDNRQVEQPMASSLMMRGTAARALAADNGGKLLDEQFPIFFNDVDLCRRLVSAGWEIWYLGIARVRHWGGSGTGQAGAAMIGESHRSLANYYRKHYRGRLPASLYVATMALIYVSGKARHAAAQYRS